MNPTKKKNRKLPTTIVQLRSSSRIKFEGSQSETEIFHFVSVSGKRTRNFIAYQSDTPGRSSTVPTCQKPGSLFTISYYPKMETGELDKHYLISNFLYKELSKDAYTLRLYKFESPVYVLTDHHGNYLSYCPITEKMSPAKSLAALEFWDFFNEHQIPDLRVEYPQYLIVEIKF